MKFNYSKEMNYKWFCPTYYFQFSITKDEALSVFHKYGVGTVKQMENAFSVVEPNHYVIGQALALLRDAYCDENVDLGINYKQKYEELVALLEPHKIDDTMEPATTLKMILKYQTGGCK
jgi:peroxiredoxin